MLLQEHVERETEAAFGKTARAAMTSHATTSEQRWSRFALVKIFGTDGWAAQDGDDTEGKYTQSQ